MMVAIFANPICVQSKFFLSRASSVIHGVFNAWLIDQPSYADLG